MKQIGWFGGLVIFVLLLSAGGFFAQAGAGQPSGTLVSPAAWETWPSCVPDGQPGAIPPGAESCTQGGSIAGCTASCAEAADSGCCTASAMFGAATIPPDFDGARQHPDMASAPELTGLFAPANLRPPQPAA